MTTDPHDLHALLSDLYAIRGRSVAGPANRRTYDRLGRELGLARHAVPTGAAVFDWDVPREWTLTNAWLTSDGYTPFAVGEFYGGFDDRSRGLDLHVVTHSPPMSGTFRTADILDRLHVHPTLPAAVPYVYKHHRPDWGLCLSPNQRDRLGAEVELQIFTELADGVMDFAEHTLPGTGEGTVIFSAHTCHPQLANDNWAGVAVLARLARELARRPRRHTYRFVFTPGTIGTLAWLKQERPERVVGGLVLACAGGPGPVTFKLPRRPGTPTERAMAGLAGDVRPFTPFDYDERQFCSPGFDLPIGRLSRTPNGEYPEYHTSADDLDLVTGDQMMDTLNVLLAFCTEIEKHDPQPAPGLGDDGPRRTQPFGELQLGKHGLYADPAVRFAALWVLNLADGRHTPRQMAERAGLPLGVVERTLGLCRERGLLA